MKARRTVVNFCGFDLDCFQLPNGEYALSRTQLGASCDKPDNSVLRWLEGNSPEAASANGSMFLLDTIELEDNPTSIKPATFKLAVLYWTYQARQGNTKAQAYLAASAEETLTRLADEAFGIVKSDQKYQMQTSENAQINQQMFSMMEQLLKNQNEQKQLLLADKSQKEELGIEVTENFPKIPELLFCF